MRWIKSHEKIELWWRRYELRVATYEWEKLEFTPLSERICEPKVAQIAPWSTYKKSGCWITNWQFYWSRSYVWLSLKICSLYETYRRGYTWRPLACYLFLNIKLASCDLLLYVVYMCQKSSNFIDAFICDKQKCKVVSLNLAHSVDIRELCASEPRDCLVQGCETPILCYASIHCLCFTVPVVAVHALFRI